MNGNNHPWMLPRLRWHTTGGILRTILVDQAVVDEYSTFLAGKKLHCRQATFKLALFDYAARLMNFTILDKTTLDQMREIVWSTQHQIGGVAHCFLSDKSGLANRSN